MNDKFALTLYVLRYIGFLINKLLEVLFLWLFLPVWRLLMILLLPAKITVSAVFYCLYLPVRFLAQFETIYIYLAVASLVGIIAGVILVCIFDALASAFRIESSAKQPNGRTVSSYRAAQRELTLKLDKNDTSYGLTSSGIEREKQSRMGLQAQTIVE